MFGRGGCFERSGVVDFRRLGIASVALASLAASVGIIWIFIRPEYVGRVGTQTLVAVFALLLLPGLAYAGWELERWRATRTR